MKCRTFQRNVADLVSGRLDAQQAREMEIHRDGCSACERCERAERELRSGFRQLGATDPASSVDISAQVAPYLHVLLTSEDAGHKSSFARCLRSQRVQLGAMLVCASAIVCFITIRWSLISEPLDERAPSDARIVTLVSDMREMPSRDTEIALADDSSGHLARRRALMEETR